jgi:hypothetical protein
MAQTAAKPIRCLAQRKNTREHQPDPSLHTFTFGKIKKTKSDAKPSHNVKQMMLCQDSGVG